MPAPPETFASSDTRTNLAPPGSIVTSGVHGISGTRQGNGMLLDEVSLEHLQMIVAATVHLGWIFFVGIFAARKAPPRRRETQRAAASIAGIVIQGAAYVVIGVLRRPAFTPIVPMPAPVAVALAAAVVCLTGLSVWTVKRAVDTLGKQWSLAARLVEGHTLITEGPYKLVRHPIYSGMLGMLIATSLAFSRWYALPAGLAFFALGTLIRVRSEERLLKQSFPGEYAAYAARVRAVIPGVL